MSIMDVLKKDLGGSKKPKEPKEPKGSKGAKDSAAAATQSGPLAITAAPTTAEAPSKMKGAPPALSASPRANLLPPEIGENHKKAAVRRGLRFGMLAILVLVVAGVGLSVYTEVAAQQALRTAQEQTQTLALERAKYADVENTIADVATGTSARYVAGSTDILWDPYIRQLESALPSDVVITSLAIDSVGAEKPYVQSTVPLEQPRIATLTFLALSTSIPSIPSWIDGMSSLPGFADAQPDSLSQDQNGNYLATVTMHINTDAFSHRFDLPTTETSK